MFCYRLKEHAFDIITTKLLKLQSLVAKCCKMRKYSPANFANFVLIYQYAREFAPLSVQMWSTFLCILIQINTKICKLCRAIIFLILQHFAAKLCNFTNFNMLFLDGFCSSCPDQNLVYTWNCH